MLFRALVLQAFGEENLPYEDYQNYPWRALTTWRKLINPFKWLEFIILGLLYLALNPTLRILLYLYSVLKVLILVAWILSATLLSFIATVIFFLEGLSASYFSNNSPKRAPFKQIFDKIFNFICIRIGMYLYKVVIYILMNLLLLIFSLSMALIKILRVLFSPINELILPFYEYLSEQPAQETVPIICFTLVGFSLIVWISPPLTIISPAFLFLAPLPLLVSILIKILLIFFVFYFLYQLTSMLRIFKIAFFDRLHRPKEKLTVKYIPLSEVHEAFDHAAAIDSMGTEHRYRPGYSNAYSRVLFNSPKRSGLISLTFLKSQSFIDKLSFSIKKFFGWNPGISPDKDIDIQRGPLKKQGLLEAKTPPHVARAEKKDSKSTEKTISEMMIGPCTQSTTIGINKDSITLEKGDSIKITTQKISKKLPERAVENEEKKQSIPENISEPITETTALITHVLASTAEATEEHPHWIFDLLNALFKLSKPLLPIGLDDAAQPTEEALEAIAPGITTEGQEVERTIESATKKIPQGIETNITSSSSPL